MPFRKYICTMINSENFYSFFHLEQFYINKFMSIVKCPKAWLYFIKTII